MLFSAFILIKFIINKTTTIDNQIHQLPKEDANVKNNGGPRYFMPLSLPKGDIILNLSTASAMHSAT